MPARASGDMCEAAWRLDAGDADCQNVAALKPGNDTRVNMILLMAARDGLSPEFPAPIIKPVFTWSDLRDRLAPPKTADISGFARLRLVRRQRQDRSGGRQTNGSRLRALPEGSPPRALRRLGARAAASRRLAGGLDRQARRAILAQPASARDIGVPPLVDEIDAKLLPDLKPDMTKDPILLAVLDLRDMRKPEQKDAALTHANLEAQRETFATLPALYEFLQAADALHVDGAPAAVLKDVPDATHRRDGDALWFSRQMLRDEAMEAAGDRNARGFWREFHAGASRPLDRATIELALALHEEKHGEVAAVFAPGSLVSDPAMRAILLAHDAGPDLLRRQASDPSAPALEREIALFTLLDKELMRGRYAQFLSDLQGVPADAPVAGGTVDLETMRGRPPLGLFVRGEAADEIGCPALATIVSHLATNPEATRDRLCLAEFTRINALSANPLDLPGSDGALGSGPAQSFPGEAHPRDETYETIIADKKAPAADRAFALYRAVKCYEPVGNNGCGTDDVSRGQRKAWYYALKRDYPSSRWAKELRYWW